MLQKYQRASKKFLSSPSQWPQSFFCKQNAMKDEEKLKLCEIWKGWIQVGRALHVKVLYFDNCTAWPPVWLFVRGCDGGQAVLKQSILTTIISWSEVVKTLQKELYISTTCRNSWSYSKRCFGYSWTGTRHTNSWKMLIVATKGFSDHIITQVRHDGWWRLLCWSSGTATLKLQ